MTIRVVHCGTGQAGRYGLRAVIRHKDLDLVGLYAATPGKIGKDAGELVGFPKTGIKASNDIEAMLALKPDCVSYCAVSHTRPAEATADVVRFLERGINVISIAHIEMMYPPSAKKLSPEMYEAIQSACMRGQSTFMNSGIDPGFANDAIPLLLLSTAGRVDSVRIQEIAVYDHYVESAGLEHSSSMLGYGLGMPPDYVPSILFAPDGKTIGQPLRQLWAPILHQIAAKLGHTIDDYAITHETWVTPAPLKTNLGVFKPGSVAAIHWEFHGLIAGVPRVTIEHYSRIVPGIAPDWPVLPEIGPFNEDRYRVLIKGEPNLTAQFDCAVANFGKDREEGGHAVTSIRTINAIPAVCAALPGIVSSVDLPAYVTGDAPWR